MWSRAELARDFRALGVTEGDVVMLHASVRSVGEVAGGPDQIHLALRDALGSSGTLMMYVGCPSYYDDVGRGVLTAEQEREVLEKHPPFDPITTRSARSHGILVEFFRTFPGTSSITTSRASLRQARRRSGSSGRASVGICLMEPVRRSTDFQRSADSILLLGSDHDEVTFLHHVEHVVDFPDKKISRYKVPCEDGGRVVWREVEEVNTAGDGAHAHWPDRFFAHIVDGYLESSGNRGARVGHADELSHPSARPLQFCRTTHAGDGEI